MGSTASARASATTRRSARRETTRHRCAAETAGCPPGRMKLRSSGRAAVRRSLPLCWQRWQVHPHRVVRRSQVTAEIEQVHLDLAQQRRVLGVRLHRRVVRKRAHEGIEFVERAVRLDAEVILRKPCASEKSRGAVVASSGVNAHVRGWGRLYGVA